MWSSPREIRSRHGVAAIERGSSNLEHKFVPLEIFD